MAKIPFYTLVEKVERGTITSAEAQKYFLAEADPDQPFGIVVGVNPNTVETTNLPNATLFADALMLDASRSIDRKVKNKGKPPRFKRNGPIVAEGDSWFKLPAIYPDTMIDVLIRDYGYPILNLARWGDTLADIVVAGEYLPHIGTGRADTLLFSAGGNDILGGGELWRFLKLFDVDHATAADAPYYILPEFYQNLDDICEVYKGVIENIRMTPSLSGTMVVGHGYDYVIPRQSGPWLGEPMMRQGLHPYFHAKLCRAIVKIMMDALNAKLSVFQTIFPSNFTYVNLRGTLTAESEWFDELHAKSNGAKKFAAKMNAALVKLKAAKDTLAPIPVPRRANRIAA